MRRGQQNQQTQNNEAHPTSEYEVNTEAIMAHQAPLKYIFYIAAIPEKVWEGFVSRESNRIIFSGAQL